MNHTFIRLAFVTAIAGLLGNGVAAQQTQGKPTRNFAKGTWQVVRRIGLDNDLLENPGPMAVDDTRAVVFDYGTYTVKSIRLDDGTVEWKSGRKGQGPGEYMGATTLRLDDAGRTIVYDPESSRITVLDRKGKLVRTVPLSGHFGGVLPGPTPSRFLLFAYDSATLVTIADTVAALRPAAPLPAEFRSAVPLTREFIGSTSTAEGHLLAFRWSSRMLLIDREGRLVRSCTAIDSLSLPPLIKSKATIDGIPMEFSKVDRSAGAAAVSITALGDTTLILRPGVSADGQMIVDLYAPNCGSYVESRRLPVAAGAIRRSRDVLVALVMEPVPHLAILRWTPST